MDKSRDTFSRDNFNNGIKRKNSTGNLSVINRTWLI